MNLKSLDKKLVGDKLRMTDPSLVFIDTNQIYILAEHVVVDSEICRIDLISLKHYRSENYVDYILKFNGISNPFSITTGDILQIPDTDSVLIQNVSIKAINAAEDSNSIRDQFINTKRLTVKDAKRSEYLARKSSTKSNGSSQILPPNILKDGNINMIIENGIIKI